MEKILEIENLSIQFIHNNMVVKAVDSVTLDLYKGEILGLVGESGSGKTLTALSVTNILPALAKVTSGQIFYQGHDLLRYSEELIIKIRGQEISYIFQEATASLNPVLTIGKQLKESLAIHQKKTTQETNETACELLKMVSLEPPEEVLKSYPHQLSGGMNQRVMIAMAVAARPNILIADEPTTALDVTMESEIIRMLLEFKRQIGFSVLFITHNLSLVEKFADRIAIMYRGRIVEEGSVPQIFSAPSHKHTRELINSIIRI